MSLLPSIPTAAELKDAGVVLEDHLAMQGKALIDYAAARINDALHMSLNAVADIEGKAKLDVQAIIAGMDGWTLTVTIPAITIQLNKPK